MLTLYATLNFDPFGSPSPTSSLSERGDFQDFLLRTFVCFPTHSFARHSLQHTRNDTTSLIPRPYLNTSRVAKNHTPVPQRHSNFDIIMAPTFPTSFSLFTRAVPNADDENTTGLKPITIAGIAVAAAVAVGLAIWLGVRFVRKRSVKKRMIGRTSAFLTVKGVVKEGEQEKVQEDSMAMYVHTLLHLLDRRVTHTASHVVTLST